jgi:predicted O-linked N-acetylglucosamine transferase (SPINDLY family)
MSTQFYRILVTFIVLSVDIACSKAPSSGDSAAFSAAESARVGDNPDGCLNFAENSVHQLPQVEAVALIEACVAAFPSSVLAIRSAAASSLATRGAHVAAAAQLEASLVIAPGDAVSLARLAAARSAVADWRGSEAVVAALRAALRKGDYCMTGLLGDCVEPLLLLYLPIPPESAAEASARACACVTAAAAASGTMLSAGRRAWGRGRIRVGYMTSDVRAHATAYLARSLLAMHRRDAVEVPAHRTHP